MPPKRPSGPSTHQASAKRARIQRGRHIPSGSATPTDQASKVKRPALGRANEAALTTVKGKMKEGMPPAIQVEKFALARSYEIDSMKKALKNAWDSSTKRAFQTMPRHLRRRAASHNARRVPSRLRAKAAAEIDPKTKKKKHFPRKKVTRKTGMSLTERYRRRQRNKLWLDTHIWMAKRMHMVNVWGFRLAHRPTAKAFRPSYRAATRSSILSDVSYFSLLELEGPVETLREVLKGVAGEICWGKRFEDGARMADTTLYEFQQWPLAFLTPAQVLWRPLPPPTPDSTPSTNPVQQVWIRFHPLAQASVLAALQTSISAVLEREHLDASKKTQKKAAAQKGETRVELRDVREEVCVFEVVGPRSGKVLKGALGELVKDEPRDETKQIWKELPDVASPGSLPRGMVMGLKTYDPRLHFPPQNPKPSTQTLAEGAPTWAHQPSSLLAASSLWDADMRKSLAKKKFKKVELDNRKVELGIPGVRLRPEVDDARLPLLLVQHTVSPSPSASPLASPPTSGIHGYLLFHPRGWSQPLLHSLVFTGTRIGGIRERDAQAFESGAGSWPRDYAGSEQASKWWDEKAKEDKLTWDRRPPAKRPNYLKNGGWEQVDLNHDTKEDGKTAGRVPWKPDWKGVVGGYLDVKSMDVAEEEKIINEAQAVKAVESFHLYLPGLVDILPSLLQSKNPALALLAAVNAHRAKRSLDKLKNDSAGKLLDQALVRVSVDMLARGVAGEVGPIFSLSSDEKGLQEEALWREGYGGGRKGRDVDHDEAAEVTVPPRSSVIGYLTSGSFSLARGHGFALGAIPLKSLLALLQNDIVAGRLAIVNNHGQASFKVRAGELVGLVKVQKREGGVARAALVRITE